MTTFTSRRKTNFYTTARTRLAQRGCSRPVNELTVPCGSHKLSRFIRDDVGS